MPDYKGHRAGSRKAAVHRMLDERGEDAAIQLGQELKLAPATVRGWIRTWTKQPTTPKRAPVGRIRAYFVGDPERELFTITARGEQQSEYRMDDGTIGAVSNDKIVIVETGE